MAETMDAQALAVAAGTTVERIEEMTSVKILVTGQDGTYRPSDIQRVRIAEALDAAGTSPDQIGQMIADGTYSTGWADVLFPEPVPMSGQTLADAIGELGLPYDMVRRVFTIGMQLPTPELHEEMRDDELELLRIMTLIYVAFGRDEPTTLAATRYMGDNIRRMAESQMRFFRETVEEPLIATGRSQREVMDTVSEFGAGLLPVGFRAAALLHRRHLEAFEIEDIVTNTEIAMTQAGLAPERQKDPPAMAFCDMTGYTSLTEEIGDREAAALTDRFGELTAHRADELGGRVVKFLGDGAMFHFPDPAAAVRCSLSLTEDLPAQGLPPAHVGVHVGNVVFRDGDYFGRTVNLAARLCSHAEPGEVLTTREVMDACAGRRDVTWQQAGSATLKGIQEPIEIFRAVRANG